MVRVSIPYTEGGHTIHRGLPYHIQRVAIPYTEGGHTLPSFLDAFAFQSRMFMSSLPHITYLQHGLGLGLVTVMVMVMVMVKVMVTVMSQG